MAVITADTFDPLRSYIGSARSRACRWWTQTGTRRTTSASSRSRPS